MIIEEALGIFLKVGKFLFDNNIGEFAGLIGLFLTFLTFWQAKGAKSAAIKAGEAAINNRDKLEIATRLSELSAKLRVIRDIYRTDDWSAIEITKDHAVAIIVEVKVIEESNKDIYNQLLAIEKFLREVDPNIDSVKDDEKKRGLKMKRSQRTNVMADEIDSIRLKKVKNGN